jgi:hypothetical protein
MAKPSHRRRFVPVVLGLAMLAVVVAAGLAPNTGAVPAQTTTQYNQSPSSSGTSPWVYAAIAAIAVVALLVAALVLMRRRRPPAAAAPPMQVWGGPGAPSAPTAPAAPPPSPSPPPPAAAPAPAYLETPEDVGVAPPPVPVSKAAAAAGAGGAAAEAEPDIDSLMAELDKISGEILKRTPKKGTSAPPAPTEEEPNP